MKGILIRRLHRTCRAVGFAEADYADYFLALTPSWEIRTLFLALQFLFAPGHSRLFASVRGWVLGSPFARMISTLAWFRAWRRSIGGSVSVTKMSQLLRLLAEQASVPVLVHQDHPDCDEMILRTLRAGYYSVMYDGGHLPLEENIKGAAYIVEIAHAMGAAVEAELGQFGGEGQAGRVEKATPDEAKRLVEESGIDTLAVSVGSIHGQSSRLELPLLEEIAEVTPVPLVLHGGSGIHPDDVRKATAMNVVKINIGADIVRAWMHGLKEGELLESGHEPPHQVMMRHASVKVTEAARAKLSLMGASHRAKPLLRKLEDATADLPVRSAAPVTV